MRFLLFLAGGSRPLLLGRMLSGLHLVHKHTEARELAGEHEIASAPLELPSERRQCPAAGELRCRALGPLQTRNEGFERNWPLLPDILPALGSASLIVGARPLAMLNLATFVKIWGKFREPLSGARKKVLITGTEDIKGQTQQRMTCQCRKRRFVQRGPRRGR